MLSAFQFAIINCWIENDAQLWEYGSHLHNHARLSDLKLNKNLQPSFNKLTTT